jgi:hypothetical protein
MFSIKFGLKRFLKEGPELLRPLIVLNPELLQDLFLVNYLRDSVSDKMKEKGGDCMDPVII